MEATFTLFPATVIAADTNTRAFNCKNFDQFYAVVTLASVGASQTVIPILQMLLPDGTTWVVLHTVASALTTAGTYIYQFGKPSDANAAAASALQDSVAVSLPEVCRFNLDVFNVANVTVTVHIIPCGRRS